MDYTISIDYTQKSTTPILALKLSVSATITPGGLPHMLQVLFGYRHYDYRKCPTSFRFLFIRGVERQ